MGNVLFTGPPPEVLERLNIDISGYPPLICSWVALLIDMLTNAVGLRDTWRQYLPANLGQEGHWFSNEFSVDDVFILLPQKLSFGEFYKQQYGNALDAQINVQEEWKNVASALYEFLFHTPQTELADMTTPAALTVLFCLVVIFRLIRVSLWPHFQALGKEVAIMRHGREWLVDKDNQHRMEKFGEYIFRLLYHGSITIYGVVAFWNAPWWNPDQGGTMNLWTGNVAEPTMIWYYLFQGAYNVDAMIHLLEQTFEIKVFPANSMLPITIGWADCPRSDFKEMFAHHVVTNLLIFLSSAMHLQRVGSMVFLVHDVSDIPVDISKLFNYVKYTPGVVVSFLTLVAVWFYTRLVVLPFTIWRSAYVESIHMHEYLDYPLRHLYALQPIFLILMALLIALHAFWLGVFVKMIHTFATTGKTSDYSLKADNKADEQKFRNGVKTNGATKKYGTDASKHK